MMDKSEMNIFENREDEIEKQRQRKFERISICAELLGIADRFEEFVDDFIHDEGYSLTESERWEFVELQTFVPEKIRDLVDSIISKKT